MPVLRPPPRLIIGDSTIRDVVSTDSSCLLVNSKGGAKTGDILSILKKTKSSTHSDIIIHVGTNDTATEFPTEKITEDLSQIMDVAKDKSATGHIVISGICPRTDDF